MPETACCRPNFILLAMPYYPEALEWRWDEEQGPPEIVEPPVGVPRSSIFGRGQKFEGRGDFRGYYGHGNSEGYYDSDGCFTRVDPGLPKPQSVSKETLQMLSGRKRRLEKEEARVAKRR